MTFGLVKPSNDADDDIDVAVPPLKLVSPTDFPRAVYVAGASSEIDRADAVMAQLRANNVIVTSTWVDNIRKVGAANPMTAAREQRFMWSVVDLHEVSQAAILLFLMPGAGITTFGAGVELGYAAALQQLVEMMRETGQQVPPNADRWLMCAGEERSIFTAICDHFPTDAAAIGAILAATAKFRAAL